MATKDQRYDPDVNYDSDQEELNNTRDQWSVSPPSSPVDQVYLAGNYIYNDVRPAAAMRSGGPLMNGGGQQSAKGGGQSDQNKQKSAEKDSEPGEHGGRSDKTTGKDLEQVKCLYCGKPIVGRNWSGSGFRCHTGTPGIITDHDQFCEKCARGLVADDELREEDEERGVMTCPKHKKPRKTANSADSDPYQV